MNEEDFLKKSYGYHLLISEFIDANKPETTEDTRAFMFAYVRTFSSMVWNFTEGSKQACCEIFKEALKENIANVEIMEKQ